MTEFGTFDDYLAEQNLKGARLIALLVAILMLAGSSLDYFMHPEALGRLFVLRCCASVAGVFCFWLCHFEAARRHTFLLGLAPILVASIALEVMVESLEGYSSPYYAGIAQCLFALGVIFYWRVREILTACTLVLLIWLVPTLAHYEIIEAGPFVNNFFALTTVAAISVASNASRFASVEREYSSRSELFKALDKLKDLDRAKNLFFTNITHELKTPLTMILAPLELMTEGELGPVTEAQRSSLEAMLRSGVRLLKLIGDLLDLSKLDESRLRLQVNEHDLVSYLGGLVSQVRSLAQRKSIEMSFESNAPSALVFCDLERLERVFVNLLSNAAKFTPGDGKISVDVEDRSDEIRVNVRDSGIGFPPELADRVFERFFQVDMQGTRKHGGTGIGLSLARELVQLHGGTISATSDGTSGATFTVTLPKGRDHFPPSAIDRRGKSTSKIGGKRAADRGIGEWRVDSEVRYRLIDIDNATEQRIVERDHDEDERAESVLVVEDTPDVIRVIHLALRGHFKILAASDGEKGLALAVKHRPNLIITDLMMPVMDGLELTLRLRKDVRTEQIPIVMLTAKGDIEHRIAGIDVGANAYLAKPFSAKELLSTVRNLLKRQGTAAEVLLHQNMNSLETISGGLAHEINNPLNYIKNALWLIRKEVDAMIRTARDGQFSGEHAKRFEDAATRMEKMHRVAETGIRRIGATVELMRRYSREGYTRALQPFDLFESARDVALMLQANATGHIETSFEGDGFIECVPEEFNQVLTNLIQNALESIPEDRDGRVRIRGIVEQGEVVLRVKDNGTGIRPEDRPRIFTPFYTTKDTGKGMGLGLTIVHRVVSAHGATITLSSEWGAGTEFTLRVPRLERPAEAPFPLTSD